MKTMKDLLAKKMIDRRALLRGTAQAGAGLMFGGLLAGCGGGGDNLGLPNPNPIPNNDPAIFNFALNLEYLEAEYYLRGAFGRGLSNGDRGGSEASVVGGRQVPGLNSFKDFVEELAIDEENHVRLIRQALGTAAVAAPTINFTDAFNAAAVAAGIGESFDPFASETNFLIGAFVFEDVGVTAYQGAAPLITSKSLLSAAAGVLAVEAYHAGALRTILNFIGGPAVDAANRISNLRASAGGGKDQGIFVNSKNNTVPADENSLTFARTTSEVLNIVTLGTARQGDNIYRGGFFPNGLNGTIR